LQLTVTVSNTAIINIFFIFRIYILKVHCWVYE
jgi:hypothetical protein